MMFLVDNGSVKPAAYQNLCSIAEALSRKTSEKIHPAPLLHANKIPPESIGGSPAKVLEELLVEAYGGGERRFSILPLFFGPSGALVDYLPRRLNRLAEKYPKINCRVLHPLYKNEADGGDLLTDILESLVQETLEKNRVECCNVVVLDHGSPRPEVTAVRNELGQLLARRLEKTGRRVAVASMERRKGIEFAFNEPLLETILRREPFSSGNSAIAQLFISPGRHAGPGGDIARICRKAEAENPGLRTFPTPLVGTHPKLIDLLCRRIEEKDCLF